MPLELNGTTGVQGNSGAFIIGTGVSLTTQTSVDFTGIPSWVKRVTINFNVMGSNGNTGKQIQIGTSGGIQTTGYNGAASYFGASTGYTNSTSGFAIWAVGSTNRVNGSLILTLQNSSDNTWSATGIMALSDAAYTLATGYSKTLNGVLTTVRLTSLGGTEQFNSGSINITYE